MSQEKLFKEIVESVRKYEKPALPLKFEKLKDDNVLNSKLLGTPYWEKGSEYPLNSQGNPLQMLAQINLSKMPQLPSFPKDGILQFFIDNENGYYGLNFDNQMDTHSHCVIYWPNPSMEKYSKYPVEEIDESPINNPLQIIPQEINREICGIADEYYFSQQYDLANKYPQVDEDEFWDFISEEVDNCGSKMGGYAYFTQSDPRGFDENSLDRDEYIILLQLDSDHEDMMWGDCGVANWFILKEDLEKLDFSKVIYNWDCC